MIQSEILKTVRHIEISTKSIINSVIAGAYHSSFKGNGMEFAEVREYVPGDDVRLIDWNVTARSGIPHIKKFVEERELTLMLAVDASASGHFGTSNQFKSEVMAALSALLAFAAVKNNDKVGLMIFTDEVEMLIPPAKGRKHVLRLVRELLCFKPESKGTNIANALEHLNKVLKRKSIVVLASDFYDTNFEKPLQLLNQRHEVLAIGVEDPRERELPSMGLLELEDPETGESHLIDSSSRRVRKAFAKQAHTRAKEREDFMKRMRVDWVPIVMQKEYKDTINPLVDYFRKRQALGV
jgi:uncharacterized protein (DUF58 family)